MFILAVAIYHMISHRIRDWTVGGPPAQATEEAPWSQAVKASHAIIIVMIIMTIIIIMNSSSSSSIHMYIYIYTEYTRIDVLLRTPTRGGASFGGVTCPKLLV